MRIQSSEAMLDDWQFLLQAFWFDQCPAECEWLLVMFRTGTLTVCNPAVSMAFRLEDIGRELILIFNFHKANQHRTFLSQLDYYFKNMYIFLRFLVLIFFSERMFLPKLRHIFAYVRSILPHFGTFDIVLLYADSAFFQVEMQLLSFMISIFNTLWSSSFLILSEFFWSFCDLKILSKNQVSRALHFDCSLSGSHQSLPLGQANQLKKEPFPPNQTFVDFSTSVASVHSRWNSYENVKNHFSMQDHS